MGFVLKLPICTQAVRLRGWCTPIRHYIALHTPTVNTPTTRRVYWGYCTHVHAVRRAHCEHAIDTGYIRSRFLLACRRFGAAFAEPCCVASPQLRWTVYSAPLVAASLLGDSPACGIPCVASLHHSPQLNPTALAAMCASQTASAISRYCSPLPLPLATPAAANGFCWWASATTWAKALLVPIPYRLLHHGRQ